MITYNLLIKLQDSSKENVDKAKTVLLSMGSVKNFAHICGWAPRRFQIASAMVSA